MLGTLEAGSEERALPKDPGAARPDLSRCRLVVPVASTHVPTVTRMNPVRADPHCPCVRAPPPDPPWSPVIHSPVVPGWPYVPVGRGCVSVRRGCVSVRSRYVPVGCLHWSYEDGSGRTELNVYVGACLSDRHRDGHREDNQPKNSCRFSHRNLRVIPARIGCEESANVSSDNSGFFRTIGPTVGSPMSAQCDRPQLHDVAEGQRLAARRTGARHSALSKRRWSALIPAMSQPATRTPLYKGDRFPPDIISHAVWLYYRFAVSLRDVSELLLARGIRTNLSRPLWSSAILRRRRIALRRADQPGRRRFARH
jgi:hypothetical protein